MPRAGLGLARGRLAHVRKSSHRTRSLSGGGSTRARRAVPVEVAPTPKRSPHKRRDLSRSVQDSGATRRSWPRARPACLRVCAHASAPPSSLSVGRRRSTRACHASAPRLEGWNWNWPSSLEGRRASKGLSRSMQGCGATRRRWPRARKVCACMQESGHCARSLSGGGAARALAARARRAMRVGIGPPAIEGRRASDRALSFGAKSPHEQNSFAVPIMLPPAQTRAFPKVLDRANPADPVNRQSLLTTEEFRRPSVYRRRSVSPRHPPVGPSPARQDKAH